MRRAGFLATLVAGFGLLGLSLHGITGVDHTLQIAAATAPAPQVQPWQSVIDRHRDCHHGHDGRGRDGRV
jgi:hypothetical protein